MAWDEELPILLRYMVFDIGTPPVYDNTTMRKLFLAAGQLIQTEIDFVTYYTVDIVNEQITPDPTLSPNRDDGFINLSLAKAACLIDNAEARLAAKRGVVMRDASKLIDLTEVSRAKLELWKNGWCANYKTVRYEYLMGNVAAGQAVIGPFRLETNWMPGPWTPDGYGTPMGGAGPFGYYGGMGSDTLNDGRYR